MKYAVSFLLFLVSAATIIGTVSDSQASRLRESMNEKSGVFPNMVDGVFAVSEGCISLEVIDSSRE